MGHYASAMLQLTSIPVVVENGPLVTFLRSKMTGGRFAMGVIIRRYRYSRAQAKLETLLPNILYGGVKGKHITFDAQTYNKAASCKTEEAKSKNLEMIAELIAFKFLKNHNGYCEL